jgi:hypothetical protein
MFLKFKFITIEVKTKMVIDFGKKELDFKKIMHILLSSVAFAFALFIVIWIVDYFSKELSNVILSNILTFLNENWPLLIGFVVFIQLWEYLFKLYKGWLKYIAPLVSSIELIFGLWLVVVFFGGLTQLNLNPQVNIFLEFINQLFFTQFIVIALLILFIKYAQFFFYESKKIDD